jgi:antitoxin CptB
MLELDLVLQTFLDHQYDEADAGEQRAFEALLSYPDPLLLEYVMGRMIPADPLLAHVVARLRTAAPA